VTSATPPFERRREERTGLWQARTNDDWRMYFTIEGDAYVLRAITPHPNYLAPLSHVRTGCIGHTLEPRNQ